MAEEEQREQAGDRPDPALPSAQDEAITAANEEADSAAPVLIVADSREPRELVEALVARGVPVDRRQISPADFVVGPIAIERKNVQDFYGSLVRKRLFEQLTRLKDAYGQPAVLLLEGDLAWVSELEQPRPFWGALLAASIDLGISVLPSPSLEASADLLAVLARRIGKAGGRTEIRYKPIMLTETDAQRFAVQGLPGIGGVMSDGLLAQFGSVRGVFAAGEEGLRKTRGIGPKRARAIVDLLDRPFTAPKRRVAAEKVVLEAPANMQEAPANDANDATDAASDRPGEPRPRSSSAGG